MTASPDNADQEKRSAALTSIVAAVLLTLLKLGVGVATNSLGMLSEALHSGFDLLAAGLTYFAVRYASLPPDTEHPYGHGKMENLSALVESLLLFITCGWIVWEAVDRLLFNPVPVKPSFLAMGVMCVSIVVDYSRSRLLRRMAKKHRSQALEADALHFSTDIWSSAVVLLGLGALQAAELLPADSALRPWLERADSLAALGVSAIIVYVSFSLGKRAVNVLLDAGDIALSVKVREALGRLPGITEISGLRLRSSGPDLFVDLALGVDSALVLEETRQLRQEVTAAVRQVAEHATVSIDLRPDDRAELTRLTRLRGLAAAYGLAPHAVEFCELEQPGEGQKQQLLELHVELPPECSLGEAHAMVDRFEERLRGYVPGMIIVTHLEPVSSGNVPERAVRLEADAIRRIADELVVKEPLVTDCHNVLLRSCGDGLFVSFHCRMPAQTSVADAHQAAWRLQTALHKRMPELARVTVHMEPLQIKPSGPEDKE